MTITIADVLKKINDDLAWRGPNGGVLGHIVLKREQAEYLQRWTLLLIQERDQLVAEQERRDLTVARVDEHGVAYNAAGESIGITGTMGPSCKP